MNRSENMKYHKLVENAGRPQGFWGKMMIKSMNKGHSELTDWALVHLEIKRNYNALDIGCGGGKTVSKLCKRIGNGKVSELTIPSSALKNQKSSTKIILCAARLQYYNLPYRYCLLKIISLM